MATDLYLRDLNEQVKSREEKAIRESGDEDLIEALDKEEDIVVGIFQDRDEYSVAE